MLKKSSWAALVVFIILVMSLSSIMVSPAVAATATPADPVPTLPAGQIGPQVYPDGFNPLTGLPVENPANLNVPPALVSITNFPVSARPQAGLSFSPFVFEIYIGEGMTRYLAMFYGDFPKLPEEGVATTTDTSVGAVTDNAMVGPIRSGRLPYEGLRKLFNGFLVMASGSSAVVPSLNQYTNVYGSDADSINSALIDVTKLEQIAQKNQKRLGELSLQGLAFNQAVPEGGQKGTRIWLKYAYLNQVNWLYDQESGAYNRYQDHADGTTFDLITDRLNGEALTFENVVVLFAPHEVVRPTIIDINLMYMKKMPALLFRDGQMYKIYWTTISEDYERSTGKLRPIRFMDADGNPFPMKPGQTWVEIVQQFTPYYEVPDSQVYYDLANKKEAGSGVWAIKWYPPAGAK
ncbi:MAG: hypothetical protein BGO78_10430 [Chloroflexi bacterium 44-23]|nr:MAG: hypothetical protein BGO78_10430 [Chloroflexi bacterium 44-23]